MTDFEKTNTKKAKTLGGTAIFYRHVPSAMLVHGTPEEADEYCRQLIEDCAEDGGFILGSECAVAWDPKSENIRAMLKSVEEYHPHR